MVERMMSTNGTAMYAVGNSFHSAISAAAVLVDMIRRYFENETTRVTKKEGEDQKGMGEIQYKVRAKANVHNLHLTASLRHCYVQPPKNRSITHYRDGL